MKYFVFPLNQFGTNPLPYLMFPKIEEAFIIFGKSVPVIQRESGKLAFALWSEDEDVEVALKNAADFIEEDLGHGRVDGYKPYKITGSHTEMKAMVHGPLPK